MKTTTPSWIAASAISLLIFPTHGLSESPPAAVESNEQDRLASEENGIHRKASDVIGAEVRNQQNEKLGNVEDMLVRLADGRVMALIVSSGGFLGVGNELGIVPPQAMSRGENDKQLKLDITKDRLAAAPRFKPTEWPDLTDVNYIERLYGAYQIEAPMAEPSVRGPILKATDIMKMEVRSLQDEDVGEVKELVLNVSLDRLASVVLASGGFLGAGDELSVIPPQALSVDRDNNRLRMDATKEALARAPRINSSEWPDRMNDPAYLDRVYMPFGIRFDAQPSGEPSRVAEPEEDRGEAERLADTQRTQDKNAPEENRNGELEQDDSRSAAADKESEMDRIAESEESDVDRSAQADGSLDVDRDAGADDRDRVLTRDIRRAIMETDDLTFSAKNVKILISNGRVTLAGTVSSEEEMSKIVELAEKHAGSGKVTNQLEVRNN